MHPSNRLSQYKYKGYHSLDEAAHGILKEQNMQRPASLSLMYVSHGPCPFLPV